MFVRAKNKVTHKIKNKMTKGVARLSTTATHAFLVSTFAGLLSWMGHPSIVRGFLVGNEAHASQTDALCTRAWGAFPEKAPR